MDARDGNEGTRAGRLQLVLLHSHGRPSAGVVTLSSSGCGMAEALTLGGERLNASQWDDAERCRISSSGAAPGWQLANGSRSVVCSVNGERVTGRRTRAVAVGDVLEVGWSRFAVEAAAAGQHLPDIPPEWRMSAGADRQALSGPAPSNARLVELGSAIEPVRAAEGGDREAFDLRDLVDLGRATHEAQFGAVAITHALDDPFGVLDIAGAERRPSRDTLAELLGESPTPDPSRGRGYDAPRRQEQPDDESATSEPRADVQSMQSVQLDHLLDHLHEEFVRVVRDPTQLAGRADWDDAMAPGFEHPPSLDELSRQAAPFPLLIDIVARREGIDGVIEGFAPLGCASLADAKAPENEDVLRLFAPALAANTRPAVPSLTRREHHGLSPDSHIGIGPSVTGPNPQPLFESATKEKSA